MLTRSRVYCTTDVQPQNIMRLWHPSRRRHDDNKRVLYFLRMRQLGVIRDKQAFSAAEVAQEEYFFCGPSPGMFLFIPCLSRMTSEISHGSLLTARFRTRLLHYNTKGYFQRLIRLCDTTCIQSVQVPVADENETKSATCLTLYPTST